MCVYADDQASNIVFLNGPQSGGAIRASVPYIKTDVPIWVLFRAMGVLADRDILEHICYDGHDDQMLEMLKPCIDEGFVVQHREVSKTSETQFLTK